MDEPARRELMLACESIRAIGSSAVGVKSRERSIEDALAKIMVRVWPEPRAAWNADRSAHGAMVAADIAEPLRIIAEETTDSRVAGLVAQAHRSITRPHAAHGQLSAAKIWEGSVKLVVRFQHIRAVVRDAMAALVNCISDRTPGCLELLASGGVTSSLCSAIPQDMLTDGDIAHSVVALALRLSKRGSAAKVPPRGVSLIGKAAELHAAEDPDVAALACDALFSLATDGSSEMIKDVPGLAASMILAAARAEEGGRMLPIEDGRPRLQGHAGAVLQFLARSSRLTRLAGLITATGSPVAALAALAKARPRCPRSAEYLSDMEGVCFWECVGGGPDGDGPESERVALQVAVAATRKEHPPLSPLSVEARELALSVGHPSALFCLLQAASVAGRTGSAGAAETPAEVTTSIAELIASSCYSGAFRKRVPREHCFAWLAGAMEGARFDVDVVRPCMRTAWLMTFREGGKDAMTSCPKFIEALGSVASLCGSDAEIGQYQAALA